MTLTTERQTLILRRRRMGRSVALIADELGVSTSSVSGCLRGAYEKLHAEHEAIEARQLELERVDELQEAYYYEAIGVDRETGEKTYADPKAADVVFKSMDRRAKLLGLDAPEKKKIDQRIKIGWLGDDEPVEGDFTDVTSTDG